MKSAHFILAFAAALTIAATIPAQVAFGAASLPASRQAEPGPNQKVAEAALAALQAANNNTYTLAAAALADSTITTIALGPNQPASASGNISPMTGAQRLAVARATFDHVN